MLGVKVRLKKFGDFYTGISNISNNIFDSYASLAGFSILRIYFTDEATFKCDFGPIILTDSPYLKILQSHGILNSPK